MIRATKNKRAEQRKCERDYQAFIAAGGVVEVLPGTGCKPWENENRAPFGGATEIGRKG